MSVIEDYPFDEAHFFELLELDCQRYVEYENPINHDFIAPHFIQSIDPRFDFLKAEIFIMKKLQRGGTIRNIKYASEIVANCLNLFGGNKFSHHFSKLTPIKKRHFLLHVLNSETENSTVLKSEFKTNNYFVCTIGVYDIYCYEDEKGVFSCWLRRGF